MTPPEPTIPVAPRSLPSIVLPAARLYAGSAAGVLAVAAVGLVFVWILRPHAWWAPLVGMVPALAGSLAGLAIISPSRPRTAPEAVSALFAGQGIGFFGAAFVAVLLHLSTRPDLVVFALIVAGAFSTAAIIQARLFAAHLRENPPVPVASGEPSGDSPTSTRLGSVHARNRS